MSLLLALELLLLLLATPRLSCASNSTQTPLDRQAEALLQWKSSLNNWSNYCLDSWTKGSNPCDWAGIACSNAMLPRGHDQGDAALVVSSISLGVCRLNGRLDRLHFPDLPHLVYLDLSRNHLLGSIPSSICALPEITHLDLSNNGLNGSIPSSIGALAELTHLDLSNNYLSRSIPTCLGNCTKLTHLDLSSNPFVGSIPPQIGQCHLLSSLRISDNSLTGEIPQELGYLALLEELDLSRNNLSGAIPATFSNLLRMDWLILSYNRLAGRVPSIHAGSISLDHNLDLCGDLYLGLTPCEHQSRKLLALFAPFSFFCLSIVSIMVVCRRRKYVNSTSKSKSGNILSIWNFDGKIAFEDILSATENFDEKYCIGVGGYGSVFRVELEGGTIFAIKLLHTMEEYSDEGAFHAEIELLTKIRHRCIVKLYGFCSHSQCKFLVYDLIERGSLSSILHDQELVKELDWPKRVTVVRDVAQALTYLHHDCDNPIVHRT
ncbi:hypothetical protein ACQJBY_005135 [Aegilops geniculata]